MKKWRKWSATRFTAPDYSEQDRACQAIHFNVLVYAGADYIDLGKLRSWAATKFKKAANEVFEGSGHAELQSILPV